MDPLRVRSGTVSTVCILLAVLLVAPVMAATTSVQIIRYANDNVTILNQTTVNYTWMEANLPVLGDGTTHYYSQGPTNNESDYWDEAEWQNIETRDWGAVKGSNLSDLCNLAGGMFPGEKVKIRASDGFTKTFPYSYVYTPNPRQGPMGITWYRADQGYVTSYADGLRLVMFADAKTSTYGWNTSGWHVFGNADMRDCWAPQDWYNYSGTWPSSGGISVKWVSQVQIMSNTPPPPVANFTANQSSGNMPLAVQFTDTSTGSPTAWAWDFDNDGTIDSILQNPVNTYAASGTYTVNLTVTAAGGTDSEVKSNYITVTVPTYEYTLNLTGEHTVTLTRAQFEAQVSGGNLASWTDTATGRVWQGLPLWFLVGAVDDADTGFAFNSALASMNYTIQVRSSDGYARNFTSSTIAANNNYIVANTINGSALPFTDPSNPTKFWWPLKHVGQGMSSGNSVGNITEIRLYNLPVAPVASFNANTTTGDIPLSVQFTDQSANSPTTWAWDVNNDGTVDYTTQNVTHTYNSGGSYTVNLTVTNAAGSNSTIKTNYIVAVAPTPDYTLLLLGDHAVNLTKAQFEAQVSGGNSASWTDTTTGRVWQGLPLWFLVGAVDDADTGFAFNSALASMNYTIQVRSSDGYARNFTSSTIAANNNYIVANTINGSALPFTDPSNPTKFWWPLKHVGQGMSSGNSVGNITEIRLYNLPVAPVAAFAATPVNGTAPLLVQFTDQSANTPTSWAWDVNNDGTTDYTTNNATHTYTSSGTYSVKLTASNPAGSNSTVKTNYITVQAPANPTLSIVPVQSAVRVGNSTQYELRMGPLASGLAGANISVSLSNTSVGEITGITLPSWAAINTTSPLPSDSIWISEVDLGSAVQAGADNVLMGTITIRGDVPGTSIITPGFIQVDADGGGVISPLLSNGTLNVYQPLVANFTANVTSGVAPLPVQFTDLSTGNPGPAMWAWDFNNDGTVDSTLASPSYSYATAGNYTVNLTVSNAFSADSEIKALYISVRPLVVPFPGYTLAPTDPDNDGLFEDINGNGRLDFDDVVAYYQNMAWITANTEIGILPYDYNGNDRIDYDDVVLLYQEVLAS